MPTCTRIGRNPGDSFASGSNRPFASARLEFVRQLADLPLQIRLVEASGEMGGGTLPWFSDPVGCPGTDCESLAPDMLAERLRNATPPVIGYILRGRFRLDLRTIFPEQDKIVLNTLQRCLTTPA
jgi:hypothetical protein